MTTVSEVPDPAAATGRPRVRVGAIVAHALAAGAIAWVLVGHPQETDRGGQPSGAQEAAPRQAAGPRIVSGTELERLASSAGLYWAGPDERFVYELTQTPEGRSFVRYLPSRAELGSPKPAFLTVATYPQPNAYAAIRTATKRPGAVVIRPPGGALAVYDRARPTSVFLAYPGGDRQIELYHPSAAEALRLVRSGAVTAVPALGAPRVVSAAELSAVAAGRAAPTYWAGRRPDTVLELTVTAQRSVFVRYLPNANAVGSRSPDYLVVGSYPRTRAFAELRAAAQRPGAVRLQVPGGGLAVYDRSHPTSVYLAYPHGRSQIEVFHPDALKARALVRSGAIVAVR